MDREAIIKEFIRYCNAESAAWLSGQTLVDKLTAETMITAALGLQADWARDYLIRVAGVDILYGAKR